MSKTPQFGTAEYQETAGNDRCMTCMQPIKVQYFRVNGATTCPRCAEYRAKQSQTDTNAAFVRGLLFGLGAAVLGLILYSVVGIVTGLQIGYLSLAVGYMVGRAIMMGSAGVGGKRYQIMAVVLTYAAVSLSAVPIGISQLSKNKNRQTINSSATPAGRTQLSEVGSGTPDARSEAPKMNVFGAVGVLALLGLASPILNLSDPLSGLIGLVILFVGIRIAWKTTIGNRVPVAGPYNAVSRA
jgi:hypothetical protein